MQQNPQIHLWCNTCWPHGGQHGSWAIPIHVFANKVLVGLESRIYHVAASQHETRQMLYRLCYAGLAGRQIQHLAAYLFHVNLYGSLKFSSDLLIWKLFPYLSKDSWLQVRVLWWAIKFSCLLTCLSLLFQLSPSVIKPLRDKGIISRLIGLDWTAMSHTNWHGKGTL